MIQLIYAREFGIRYHDLPEGADDSFFICKELIQGYLDGITGVYQTPQGYYVDDSDVELFDKDFPPKQKLKLPGQYCEQAAISGQVPAYWHRYELVVSFPHAMIGAGMMVTTVNFYTRHSCLIK